MTGLVVLAFVPLGAAALSSLPRAVLGALVACAMAPLMKPAPSLWTPQAGATALQWRHVTLGWITAAATLLASPRLEYGLAVGLCLTAVGTALDAAARAVNRRHNKAATQWQPAESATPEAGEAVFAR